MSTGTQHRLRLSHFEIDQRLPSQDGIIRDLISHLGQNWAIKVSAKLYLKNKW